jgi:hypothetical protein
MDTASHKPAYDILREENGEWVPAECGDGTDAGGITLPQEVLDRVTEGRPGKLEVEGEAYWIKPTASQPTQGEKTKVLIKL